MTISIDNQLPAWTVTAGGILIILMITGIALKIARDIIEMHAKWNACTGRDYAHGSNVPQMQTVPPMPKPARIKLKSHKGVDMEEITLREKVEE